MRNLLVIVTLFVASLACGIECQWSQWKVEHEKAYASVEEDQHRLAVFQNNAAAGFGEGPFADLTDAELTATHFRPKPHLNARQAVMDVRPTRNLRNQSLLPKNYITPWYSPVRNQASCGNCWSFATIGVAEGAFKRSMSDDVPKPSLDYSYALSVQQLLECDNSGENPCSGGRIDRAWSTIVNTWSVVPHGGIMREKDFPYVSGDGSSLFRGCRYNRTGGHVRAVGFDSFNQFDITADDEGFGGRLEVAIWQFGSVSIEIAVNNDIARAFSPSSASQRPAILTAAMCANATEVNHGVVIVGWGETAQGVKYWVVKNSWGMTWGEPVGGTTATVTRGFFRIERGANACMMRMNKATYTVASNSPLPQASPYPGVGVCVPKKTAACLNVQCGEVETNCPGELTLCGTCASGKTCSAENVCTAIDINKPWRQIIPAGFDNAFTVSNPESDSPTVTLEDVSQTVKAIVWSASKPAVRDNWMSVSAQIKPTLGMIGFGIRLGQATGELDGVSFRLTIASPSSGSSSFSTTKSICTTVRGIETCKTAKELVNEASFGWKSASNITINFVCDGATITAKLYRGGYLEGKALSVNATAFPTVGPVFLLASGPGAKVFESVQIISAPVVARRTVQFSVPAVSTPVTTGIAVAGCITVVAAVAVFFIRRETTLPL